MFFKTVLKVLFICAFFQTFACGQVTTGQRSNSLILSWAAPTTNEDGTDLDDLGGYRVYYGHDSSNYASVVIVPPYTTTAEVGGLGSGTYYFSVTACDYYGNESSFSNEVAYTFE